MNLATSFRRFSVPSTVNLRIFHAAATVGVFSVLVKLVATLKELAIANSFGRGDAVDAFLLALMIPSFVVALVAGSLNAALIPSYVQVREHEGEEAAQKLLSGSLFWSLIMLLTVALVLAAGAPALFRAIAPGFPPAKLALTTRFFYVLLPMVLLSGITVNCGAVLNARRSFWLPAITPMLSPALMIVLLMGTRTFGVWALPIGLVLGTFLESVLLMGALWRRGILFLPRWYPATPALRRVRAQYIPLLFGSVLSSGVVIVDQTMAARLQPGSVAALGYGNRIVNVVVALTAVSLSSAVIPYFSEMVARRQWAQCRHTLKTYTWLIASVTIPVGLGIALLSQPIVRLLFQRGAFTAADTALVARVQAMYAFQIPVYAVSLLYIRLLTALNRNDLVMISALINLTLDVILNIICIRFFGLPGIALSTSLFYAGSLIYAVVVCRRVLRNASAESPLPLEPGHACV
ncbi:MAG: murein biosynthesis integral membrane protein MurJ [Terracidiphilus sp.]|jgi:putative peptidoglycan lipid II flippase